MIKGTQRQMVMVRTVESELFETAYFVLRTDACEKKASGGKILDEANKLVSEACTDNSKRKKEKKRHRMKKLALFILGAICGSGLSFAVFRLISII